ncbi:Hypothetical predicted protein [Mytilus galloprovincialis]|uniref:CCHC-type domain-containing protein n=1 Tax=Mytilus galloprovincialis TaxID=29158 RepID=A0A8B6ENE7_MYTGA|nr:Hypothetical predicted protein [Mytilus galloprovincialis]
MSMPHPMFLMGIIGRTIRDRNNNPENIPKCYYCGRPGHYARKCYSNPNRQPDYRNNMATPPRQMNMPYTPPNSSMSQGSEQSVASNVIARQVLRSDGVYVEGHIQGSEVNFTVDTGAVRTVLSVYAFNKIPHVNRPILEKSNTLACADGKPLKELGKAIFEIKLGNLCFDTEMIVANIEDEALLGLDVLMKSQWGPADIKLTEGIILLGGHAVHCTQIGQTNKFIRKIYGEAYYEIPPRSENFVDVFIDRLDDDSPETVQDCILQPTEKFSERFPLVMAPCLVNSNSSQANISQDVTCNTSTCSIMNPYMYDQDTVIGSAEVVEHEPKMLLKCEDTLELELNNQIAMRRLQFHDSNLESGKGVSKEEIGRHLTTKEKDLTPEPPPTIHFVHVATMLQLHKKETEEVPGSYMKRHLI